MRQILKKAVFWGGVSLSVFSLSAQAGDCGLNAACQSDVVIRSTPSHSIDPMYIYSQNPMGHLRSVQYLGTPSVNIMRVHSAQPVAELSDAPGGIKGDCLPYASQYCRKSDVVPQAVAQPVAQPVITPPAMPAPVVAAPVVTERVVHVGGGYDPSKFEPRIYGSMERVPGIAHIPTSIVDRSHANAHAWLESGQVQPQPVIQVPQAHLGTLTQTVTIAPEVAPYGGSVGADGTYWEKVSGATTIDGMSATQVVCKRQAPQIHVQHDVHAAPSPAGCIEPSAMPMMSGYTSSQPVMAGSSRYGH